MSKKCTLCDFFKRQGQKSIFFWKIFIILAQVLSINFSLIGKKEASAQEYLTNQFELSSGYNFLEFLEPAKVLLSKEKIENPYNPSLYFLDLKTSKMVQLPEIKSHTLRISQVYSRVIINDQITEIVALYDEEGGSPSNLTPQAVIIRTLSTEPKIILPQDLGVMPSIDKGQVFDTITNKGLVVIRKEYRAQNLCSQLPEYFTCEDETSNNESGIPDFRLEKIFRIHVSLEKQKPDWPVDFKFIDEEGKYNNIALPVGPFIQPSNWLKSIKAFSCGPSCYQHFDVAFLGKSLYGIAYGWAVDNSVRGIYELKNNQWIKKHSLPENALSIYTDGSCIILWREIEENANAKNDRLVWVNLCDSSKP